MIKNKRKVPNFQDENISKSKFIDFIQLSKYQKRLIKFKSLLKDKKDSSLTRKNSKYESVGYFEIKSVYNYIIKQLDSLMRKLNENNLDYTYSLLIKIKNAIGKIISDKIIIKRNNSYRTEIKIKSDKEDKCNSCNDFRHTFDKKFIVSREKEKDSFNKINSYMIETTPKRFFRINNIKKIKILKQKNINLEDKLKTDKLKYLFCIGDQNKKIKELEKELNKKSIDSMPQDELKKYRCFPYYKKFDLLDNYTQQSKIKNKNKGKSFNHENLLFDQKYNLNKSEKESDLVKSMIDCGEKIFHKRELEGNKVLDKDKSYFISHPKLKYIKGDLNMKTWKINDALDSLPQDILKHKFTSKSQKNNLIVFPSSLNQIIVNLEKLRIHNNFQRIEDEFRKNNLIKKEKNP